MPVRIVTDSSSSIPPEMAAAQQITEVGPRRTTGRVGHGAATTRSERVGCV